MHFGQTWIGHIATVSANDTIAVDAAKLLRHLLLFDQVIVHSIRLREFSSLAATLGGPSLSVLHKSGALVHKYR